MPSPTRTPMPGPPGARANDLARPDLLSRRAGRLPWRAGRRAGAALAAAGLALATVAAPAGVASAATAKPRPPVLAFSPAPFDYGQVAAGQAVSQTFTLANTGGRATGKLAVTLAGPAAFTITGGTCHSLAPGKTCTVTVRFAPAHTGTVTATLTAASKKRHLTATDALTGTGGLGAAPGHLYWTATTPGALTSAIWESDLDGSNAQILFPTTGQPFGIAVDTSHIYWTDGSAGTINEAGLDGSNPHPIVTGQQQPAGIAVDASHLYWTDQNNGGGGATVNESGLDGSSPHAIVTGLRAPSGIAVDASHLYWADTVYGTINQANLTGGNPHIIVSGEDHPFGVTADGSHLYWADHYSSGASGAGTINEAGLDGSAPHVIVTGQIGPSGVAVDASTIYWASTGLYAPAAGSIGSANLDGTSPQVIVPGQTGPTMVAVGPVAGNLAARPYPHGRGLSTAETETGGL